MWPYRDEVARLLRKDKEKDGTVHINDIYAAKVILHTHTMIVCCRASRACVLIPGSLHCLTGFYC